MDDGQSHFPPKCKEERVLRPGQRKEGMNPKVRRKSGRTDLMLLLLLLLLLLLPSFVLRGTTG